MFWAVRSGVCSFSFSIRRSWEFPALCPFCLGFLTTLPSGVAGPFQFIQFGSTPAQLRVDPYLAIELGLLPQLHFQLLAHAALEADKVATFDGGHQRLIWPGTKAQGAG